MAKDDLSIPESVLAELAEQAPRSVLWMPEIPAGLVILPSNQPFKETAVTWLAALGYERPYLEKALEVAERVKLLRGLQSDLTGRLQILKNRQRCNGWITRRGDGAAYAHHGLNYPPCPMHGSPKNGAARGLRKYVSAAKIEEAEKAMSMQKLLEAAAGWLNAVERELENWERFRQQPFVYRTDLVGIRQGLHELDGEVTKC